MGTNNTRYCNIHRMLWNDDKFPWCSDDCQLVTLHVFTTNYMTNFGLSQVSVHALADQKKWGPKGSKKADHKRYLKAFHEGSTEGFFKYDDHLQMLYVPNLKKYNPPGNPNILVSWGKLFNEFPECELKVLFFQDFKAFMEAFGEAFRDALGKAFLKPLAKSRVYVNESESEELNPNDTEPKEPDPTKKIHIDKLTITEPMRTYAAKHGINGHVLDVFGKMVQHVHKKGTELTRTIRRWEAQFQTFIDNAHKYNPEFIDATPTEYRDPFESLRKAAAREEAEKVARTKR